MHDEKEAERLFQQGLVCCGLSEAELPELKKGDDRKKVIAWHIRRKTSVRTEWITTRLKMGVTSNFSCYVRAVGNSNEEMHKMANALLKEKKNKTKLERQLIKEGCMYKQLINPFTEGV